MTPSSRLRQGDSTTPALAFLGCFVFGSIVILALKYIGAHQAIVTAVPVIIMLGFAYLTGSSRFLRLRNDQAGDNLYYLGFLYTLVSLAISLYQFSTESVDGTSIITNFGVAIATTIIGLALRIGFAQMRTDPVEVERNARVDLAEASRGLRSQLGASAQQFSLFVKQLQQMTSEELSSTTNRIGESLESTMAKLEESVEKLSLAAEKVSNDFDQSSKIASSAVESIGKGAEDFERRIGAIEISEHLLSNSLEPPLLVLGTAMQKFDSTVQGVTDRLNEIELPDKKTADFLEQAVQNLDEASAQVSRNAARDGEKYQKWIESSEAVQTSLSQFAKSAIQGAKATENLVHKIDEFQKNDKRLLNSTEGVKQTLDHLAEKMENDTKATENLTKELKNLDVLNENLKKIEVQLDSLQASGGEKNLQKPKLSYSWLKSKFPNK
jgi:methyl-accepting chemotaxis protein